MIRKLSCIPMTQKAAALRLGRQIGRFQNTPPDPSYWSTHAAALGVGLQEIQVKNTAERFSSLTAGDGDDYSRTRQVWQEEVRIVHPWWYNSIRRFCTIGCSRAGTDEPIITVQRFADHVHLAHPYTWMLGPGAALVRGNGRTKLWWWMQDAASVALEISLPHPGKIPRSGDQTIGGGNSPIRLRSCRFIKLDGKQK